MRSSNKSREPDKDMKPIGRSRRSLLKEKEEWRACWSKQWIANYYSAMLHVGRQSGN